MEAKAQVQISFFLSFISNPFKINANESLSVWLLRN